MFEKFKIDSKLLRQLDFGAIITAVLIGIFGCVNIYSALRGSLFKTQMVWIAGGLIIVYIILTIDYSFIGNYAKPIYWIGVIILGVNDAFGQVSHGARSWVGIGSFGIQPSEFVKIGLIIMLAKQLDDMEGKINDRKNLFMLCMYALIPMILIVIQPDMGMTLVTFSLVLGMFFMAGLDLKVLFGGLTSILVLVAIVWNSGLIDLYQKNRIYTLFNPSADKLNTGYQLWMSQIGIGSGGILGRGFLNGTANVPENQNDFIFSVVGEEWGLIGGIFLLILYGILIYKIIKIAKNSKDIFGSMMCIGIVSVLLFSVLENIGMTIGIMPITGITLPFMSAGGSSILTNFISLGLVLNVGMRRKKINF